MIRVAAAGRAPDRRVLPMLLVGNGIVGGMEEYVLSVVRRFRERGRRALVGAPFIGEFTAALLEEGFPPADLHVLEMSDRIDVGALARLTSIVRSRHVSLLHTNLQPADTLGAAAAAHAGVPCLSTLHGIHRCREELLLRDLYGLRYVAVSEAGRASAIVNGLAPEEVRVVVNGVDTQRFDPSRYDRASARDGLGLGDDEVLVTTVSRLSPEKSPELFLRAAERAAAAEPRLVFAVVGSGPLASKLQQMAAASPAAGRLRLLGARRDIPEILAASDVAALASRTESLPFSVLEAMAMGLPVVSHDVGGVGEALRDGREGFLVAFGRTARFAARLIELAADPGRRAAMGEAARRRVRERFDVRRTADELLAVYAEVAARGRRGFGPSPAAPATIRRRVTSPRGRNGGGSRPHPGARNGPRPVVDAHLHLGGDATAAHALDTLEAAGVASACLIGPFLHPDTWVPVSGAALRTSNDRLLRVVAAAPERLWALVSVDPREADAARQVAGYAEDPAVRGVKLVPHGWRPDAPEALRVYEACEAAGLPILFHSGVFISGRAADACRPALYEAVRAFPALRVVLAHLGWPWVDEAIAVALMDPLAGRARQILLDLSPGTPPVYRVDALRKALAVLGTEALLFGSDRFLPTEASAIREQIASDAAILRECGAGPGDLQRILHGNALNLFGGIRRPSRSKESERLFPADGRTDAACEPAGAS